MTTLTETSTLADFRAFYAEIPDEKWCVGVSRNAKGQCCAIGFIWRLPKNVCDTIQDRRRAVARDIINVNDGNHPDYQQRTPKARVLAYLDDLIAKEK